MGKGKNEMDQVESSGDDGDDRWVSKFGYDSRYSRLKAFTIGVRCSKS